MVHRMVVVAAMTTVIALAAGCSGGNVVDTSVDKSLGFSLGNGAAVVYKIGHRYAADGASGTTLTGQQLNLDTYRGKVVVINFWGSWCSECVQETPYLNYVARADENRGVAFVGIDERDTVSNGRAYEQRHHVPYPSLSDPAGKLTLAFPHSTPDATPTTLVLDRKGDIAARVSGALDYTHLNNLVNHLLGEPA